MTRLIGAFLVGLASAVIAVVIVEPTSMTLGLVERDDPGVSESGRVRLYADNSEHRLKVSENGGNFVAVLTENDAASFQAASEKGQANGYAALGATSLVPLAQLASGPASAGQVLTTNGTTTSWQTPAGGASMTTLRTTANQTINGTGFQNVTDLSFPVSASTNYAFKFYVVFQSAATTTGFRFAMNGPAGSTPSYFMTYQTVANSTTVGVATWLQGHWVTYDAMAATTTTIAANADLVVMIEGRVNIGATPGTVAVRVASELANNDLTVRTGSWGYFF